MLLLGDGPALAFVAMMNAQSVEESAWQAGFQADQSGYGHVPGYLAGHDGHRGAVKERSRGQTPRRAHSTSSLPGIRCHLTYEMPSL